MPLKFMIKLRSTFSPKTAGSSAQEPKINITNRNLNGVDDPQPSSLPPGDDDGNEDGDKETGEETPSTLQSDHEDLDTIVNDAPPLTREFIDSSAIIQESTSTPPSIPNSISTSRNSSPSPITSSPSLIRSLDYSPGPTHHSKIPNFKHDKTPHRPTSSPFTPFPLLRPVGSRSQSISFVTPFPSSSTTSLGSPQTLTTSLSPFTSTSRRSSQNFSRPQTPNVPEGTTTPASSKPNFLPRRSNSVVSTSGSRPAPPTRTNSYSSRDALSSSAGENSVITRPRALSSSSGSLPTLLNRARSTSKSIITSSRLRDNLEERGDEDNEDKEEVGEEEAAAQERERRRKENDIRDREIEASRISSRRMLSNAYGYSSAYVLAMEERRKKERTLLNYCPTLDYDDSEYFGTFREGASSNSPTLPIWG